MLNCATIVGLLNYKLEFELFAEFPDDDKELAAACDALFLFCEEGSMSGATSTATTDAPASNSSMSGATSTSTTDAPASDC